MTAIYDQLSERGRKVMMVLIAGSTAMLLLVLGVYAVYYVLTVYQLGGISPALGVPYYLVYLAAPAGLFLAALQYLLIVVKNLTSPGVWIALEKQDDYEEPISQEI
jgi:TRAP-type C4-dicarboxylate transport system permease small subunit